MTVFGQVKNRYIDLHTVSGDNSVNQPVRSKLLLIFPIEDTTDKLNHSSS